MNKYMDTSFVDSAIEFALNKHKNTSRKGNQIPYILHPLEAMSIVASITEDKELIVAAALHDLIEDTDVTYDEIKENFGLRVADIVKDESNNMLPDYENLSWKDIKKLGIDKIKNSSIDSKIVALADKLSNMRAIHNDYIKIGEELWQRFNEHDPRLHKWRFNELLNCFDELKNTSAYKEFKWLVEETFSGVDDYGKL